MNGNSCCASIYVAELHMGSLLTNFLKTKCLEYGNNLAGPEDRTIRYCK